MKKLLLLILLTLSLPSVSEIRCGGDIWTVQVSITSIDRHQVIITKYACTKGGEFIDGQFYEDGKPSKPIEHGNVGYAFAAQVIDSNDNIVEDFIGGGNELSIVDTPEGFPFLTFLSSYYAANFSHTYLFYSTFPTFKKIAEITDPLNMWQANNKQGSERVIDGFYQDSDGNFLLDRLTTEHNEADVWPPKSDLETFKISESGIVSLGIRDFDINNYQRLE
jgi:hypothetical protein